MRDSPTQDLRMIRNAKRAAVNRHTTPIQQIVSYRRH